jgi:Cys-tRNA(Pro)/Cys-tRNA(Cys) deacylase
MVKTNVMRILEKEKVSFESYEYPHGKEAVDGVTVARLLSQDPKTVFKTLVTSDGKKDYYVFVIPVEKELDLKKAARAVEVKSLEMIPVKDIQRVTGYVRGGCSPIGMKKLYKTVFHESAFECEVISVSAGKIGYQVRINPSVLATLAAATIADVCKQ